jgi:hypothetical protein
MTSIESGVYLSHLEKEKKEKKKKKEKEKEKKKKKEKVRKENYVEEAVVYIPFTGCG